MLGAAVVASAAVAARPTFAAVRIGGEPALLARAQAALDAHGATVANRDLIGIVDFAERSCDPRFHLVDLMNGRTETILVAHGRGSDPANIGWVQNFSNRPGSNASSNGSFVTGDTYIGKHGRSRKLHGLDPTNNMAAERAIVIHQASYVGQDMARAQGRIGRSEGCFAVAPDELQHGAVAARPGAAAVRVEIA